MVRDAEMNSAADLKRKEAVEARNELDSLVLLCISYIHLKPLILKIWVYLSVCLLVLNLRLIWSTTKNLDEHADKLDDATKAEIKTAIDEAKALDSSTEV